MQYVRLFRRYLWVLFLFAFIGGSISFIGASRQPVVYRSNVILAVGGVLVDPNPNATVFNVGPRLLNTYSRLVRTFNVLQATADNVDFPITPQQINAALRTTIIPETLLLELSIVFRDPVAAADIANELARQLILATPSNITPELEDQIAVAEQEVNELTSDLLRLRAALDEVERQIADGADLSTEDLAELNTERRNLITQINDTSGNIASFSNLVASVQSRINTLDIVEEARPALAGSSSNPLNTTLIGAAVGFFLAGGVVMLLEYLNDTFRNASHATQVLHLPVLGVIGRFGRPGDSYRSRLITEQPNLSRTPEEYRTLRTNLLFAVPENERMFVISSASPQEGKSVTAANLAVSLALAGQSVILVDADLRRPRVHQVFGVSNEVGLTALLSSSPPQLPDIPEIPEELKDLQDVDEDAFDNTPASDAARTDNDAAKPAVTESPEKIAERQEHRWRKARLAKLQAAREEALTARREAFERGELREAIQETNIPGLSVITSGFIPQNPTEVLGSVLMKGWARLLREAPGVDVVIFDTPPVLAMSDSTVLAASIEAKVLLVIEAKRTRRTAAMRALERFNSVKATVVGVVLNGANLHEEDYYDYAYQYYYRYDSAAPSQPSRTE